MQGAGLKRFAVGPKVAVDRGADGAPGVSLAGAFVAGGNVDQLLCIFDPLVGGVCQVDRRALKPRGSEQVAIGTGIGCGREEVFGRPVAGDMFVCKAAGLCKGGVEVAFGQEGKFGCAGGSGTGGAFIGGADPRRISALVGLLVTDVGFQETGVGLGVEGHALTGGIGDAGRFAGVERRVEDRLEVGAVEIGVFGQDKSPLGNVGTVLRRHGKSWKENGCDEGKGRKTHKNLLSERIRGRCHDMTFGAMSLAEGGGAASPSDRRAASLPTGVVGVGKCWW